MRRTIHVDDVPVAPADFSQAMTNGDLLFTAGQVPMTADGTLHVDEPTADQTRLCLENVEKILAAEDLTTDDVMKTTVYLADLEDFDEMNRVYQEFFSPDMPARSVVEVENVLKYAAVKIEAVATY